MHAPRVSSTARTREKEDAALMAGTIIIIKPGLGLTIFLVPWWCCVIETNQGFRCARTWPTLRSRPASVSSARPGLPIGKVKV